MNDYQKRLLNDLLDPAIRPTVAHREAIAEALEEIERLKVERDRLIASCLLAPQTWTEKTMAVMEGEMYWIWQYGGHYGIAVTKEGALKAVREAAGLSDDEQVRAVLDQAARDTAAVAGRERAGEATGGDTMDFRVKGDGP